MPWDMIVSTFIYRRIMLGACNAVSSFVYGKFIFLFSFVYAFSSASGHSFRFFNVQSEF